MQVARRDGNGYEDRGPRTINTFDKAWTDDTVGLHRLASEDEGMSLRTVPSSDDEAQIRELYAFKRFELKTLGARIQVVDFYRPPRSAAV